MFDMAIFEKQGDWAVAMRRSFDSRVHVSEIRTLDELDRYVQAHPSAVCGIELTAGNIEPIIVWLEHARQDWPSMGVVVLSDRSLVTYRPLFMALGVFSFEVSTRELDSVAQMILQHYQNRPAVKRDFRQDVMDRLPLVHRN